MAPTIQNGGAAGDKRPPKPQEKKADLICRAKYHNVLPDIPFDLKFITYPFESDRFIQYNPTSLERKYRYEVLTEHDLGVTIDLINVDLYKNTDPHAQLDPADEKLLEEDLHTVNDSRRSRQHARSVSWLRKSEYISTEATRFQPSNMDKIEAKVGYNVKKSLREETLYLDRDSQIKAIQKTFEDTKIPIENHHSKPGVRALEVLPVFPDFENWKYPCAQVIFDFDPAPANKKTADAIEEMSQAMIRGVMDESGEQFVAYFLPTDDTLVKRRRDFEDCVLYKDDEEYEYKMAREYNWNVKSKASKGYEENYFLVVRDNGVFYDELETRVRLSKRRQKVGQAPTNTKLVVKHRVLNANEHKVQRWRERQLEQTVEEDEDADDGEVEEEHQENETITKTGEKKESDVEPDEEHEEEEATPRPASSRRSRSRTRASSAPSRSGSGSSSGGSPKSGSGSRSGGSRSGSGSRSRSASGSRKSGSASRSRSRSRSASGSAKSGSRSRSGSGSRSRSGSGSRRSKSGSRSPSGSEKSGSRSGSGSPESRKSVSGSERSGSDSD